MDKFSNILLIAIAFSVGMIVNNTVMAQTQNQTGNAPVVQAIDNLVYVVIIPIVLSALSIIKSLVDKGILSKRIGTVAVMAGDTAMAVADTRQTVNKVAQTSYETAKLASPDAARYADEVVAPLMNEAGRRISEYKPKADDFAAIARTLGKKGENTTEEIKEIRDKIPDEIVPS